MPTPPLKTLNCKTCGRAFSYASVQSHPSFPLCSERCQMVDLGRWFNGDYAIPSDEILDEDDGSFPLSNETDA